MIGTGLRHTIGVSDPNKGGLPMPIYYSCRYCGDYLGKVDQPIEEERLGFHILSPSERDSVISGSIMGIHMYMWFVNIAKR